MKNLLFFAAALFLFTSCGPSMTDLAIDNPTGSEVELWVDSLHIQVPANEVVWIEMGRGNHKITLPTDSIVDFNFTQKVYMLNPTMSEYLMYEELYGTSPTLMLNSPISNKTINYMGMEIEGNYELVKDLVNPIKWDLGPREEAPEMIEIEAGDRPALVKLMGPTEFFTKMMSAAMEAPETVPEAQ